MDKVIKKINSGVTLTIMEQLLMLTSEKSEDLLATYAETHEIHPRVQQTMLYLSNSPKLLAVYAKKHALHKQAEEKMLELSNCDELVKVYIRCGHKFWDETELKFFNQIKTKSLVREYIGQNIGLLSDAALDIIEQTFYR